MAGSKSHLLRRGLVTVLVVVALGIGGLTAWTLTTGHKAAGSPPPSRSSSTSTTTTQPSQVSPTTRPHHASAPVSRGVSLVARLAHNELGYDKPGGRVVRVVPGKWYDIPSMLLVIRRVSGWLDVRLAQRPNETTSWIRSKGIKITTTDYS